jgi:hypothetical protein
MILYFDVSCIHHKVTEDTKKCHNVKTLSTLWLCGEKKPYCF